METPVSNKVLKQITEKTQAAYKSYSERTYKDILRNLIGIFNNLYYIDKNNNSINLKCFHANQERAIAKVTTGDNITLPVLTISETESSNADERRRYSPILVHDKYWDKDKRRSIRLLSLAPKPININYQINIWAKYKEDLDQIRENVFILFNPDLELPLKNNNINKAFFVSETDGSEVEVADQQDRILRKSVIINVESYIPSPKFLYTSTGKIEQFFYELEIDKTLNQ